MKRRYIVILFVIMLCGATGLRAQHYVGARGGYGGGYGRFFPVDSPDRVRRNQKVTFGLFNGGIAWKYYSPEKYVGGVGAEIEFIQRGFEYHLNTLDSDTTYRRVVNSVNIPFIWQPHINFANNKMRIFLNAGIDISYNFSSKEYIMLKGEGAIYSSDYDMKLVRDNPFGFGLLGGLGFNVIMGKWELTTEARYYFSYGDVLRNKNKYPGSGISTENPLRSPVDNINVSIGFFYRIGDKPHAPQPGPGAIKRQQEKQRQKELKQQDKDMARAEKEARRAEKQSARNPEPDEKQTIEELNPEKTIDNGSERDDKAAESSQADTEGHQRDIQP